MRIGVLAETGASERRVAITPKVAATLTSRGHEILVESRAGDPAGFSDSAYTDAGATISSTANLGGVDLVAFVGPPAPQLLALLATGTSVLGFLDPHSDEAIVAALAEHQLTAFAFEAVPRTTLAQSVDALSSQATAAGYAAVVLAAHRIPKFFPMLTTAAGTVPPAKVLVIGAGVAGLQAIATARRLGGVVSGYDIRPEVREQIESLGARFVTAPVEDQASADGGYATEVGEAARARQIEALAEHVVASDVVITTAAVPGRPAPRLIEDDAVAAMRPGSVIVDLAAATGGNCSATRPDEEVDVDGTLVLGPTDLPSHLARDASEMYARNVQALVDLLTGDDGVLTIDLDNEIVAGCCVVLDGEIRDPRARDLLVQEESA